MEHGAHGYLKLFLITPCAKRYAPCVITLTTEDSNE